jgi:uncharacterized protein (TIGR03435 family)
LQPDQALSSRGSLGGPAVDQAGLTGTYDFVMGYATTPRPSYAPLDSDGPGLQEGLKQQLGLKLEANELQWISGSGSC